MIDDGLDEKLSRLGSQADLYLMGVRGPSTVAMVQPLVEHLLKRATEALEALRDADPSARIEVEDAGLADNLRVLVTGRHEMEEVAAPDDLSDLLPGELTDDETRRGDIAAIGIIADERDFAVMLTTRGAVNQHRKDLIYDEEWAQVREALWRDNRLITILASQLVDKTREGGTDD